MGVCGRAGDVASMSKGFQFGDEVDTMASSVLRQVVELFGCESMIVKEEIGDGGEAHCTTLVVGDAELQGVELPVGAEIDDAAVVGERLGDAGGVEHEAAEFWIWSVLRGQVRTGGEAGESDAALQKEFAP